MKEAAQSQKLRVLRHRFGIGPNQKRRAARERQVVRLRAYPFALEGRPTPSASRTHLVHSIHLFFASELAESEPKWFMGQYAKTARP